ncbi:MAG TPA: hypothetical protein VGJ25_11740 [Gaiellaceae bacterium]
MGRAAVTVLALVALVASGWAFVENGGHLHKGGSVALLGGTEAVDIELQAAASQMLQAKIAAGSFQGIELRHFHNLTIARADDLGYCLQVGYGDAARHLAGPGGTPTPGAC